MKPLVTTLVLCANCALAQPDTIVGYAYDEQKAALRYTETYTQQYDQHGILQSSRVQYQSPTQETLAEKKLDYRQHRYAPELSFENHSADYAEAIHWLGTDTLRIQRRNPGEDWAERTLQVPEPVVADAGFDGYIKDNIEKLIQGEILRFNFLNPARLDWFKFTAQALEVSDSTVQVKVAPANAVLRWLVEPILLTYQLSSQNQSPAPQSPQPRLLHYSGLTNISLDGQSTLIANIFYEYADHHPKQIVKLF